MQTMPPQLIVTRPIQTGESFARKVEQACGYKICTVLSPGLEVVPLNTTLPANVQHVIFTSAQGVAQAKRLLVPPAAHAWCVGRRTAEAAQALGFKVTVGGGDAVQLLHTMQDSQPVGPIVHIAGVHTRGDIAGTLRTAGMNCTAVAAYDQRVLAPKKVLVQALSGDQPVVIPLFSIRSGLTLTAIDWRAPVHVVAISQAVADSVTDWGADTVQVAERPDENSMITVTCRTLDRLKDGVSVT